MVHPGFQIGLQLGTVEQAGSVRKLHEPIDIAVGRGLIPRHGAASQAGVVALPEQLPPVPWPPVLFSPLLGFPARQSATSTCTTTVIPPGRPGAWRLPVVTLRMPPASSPPS